MEGTSQGTAVLSPAVHRMSLRAPDSGCKDGDMTDLSIAKERAIRETAIQRIVAQEDRALIAKGIETYKHDLPKLLQERREHQKIAYKGTEQVAIAPTYRKLERVLRKKGYADERELFITSISRLEGVEQDSLSR
jgi:hypothetical protein